MKEFVVVIGEIIEMMIEVNSYMIVIVLVVE